MHLPRHGHASAESPRAAGRTFSSIRLADQQYGTLPQEKVGDLRLFTAVPRVAAGGSALDPDVVARLIGRPRRNSPLDELTRREREVLSLIAEGRPNAGVAAELVITVGAVERHVTSIFDKLGLRQSPEQHRCVVAVLTYLGADCSAPDTALRPVLTDA
jgi:DNA-binding NarL/FixJ family response regulator